MKTKQTILYISYFAIFALISSGLYIDVENKLALLRMHSFVCCYFLVLFPLWFHQDIQKRDIFFLAIFTIAMMLSIGVVISWKIPASFSQFIPTWWLLGSWYVCFLGILLTIVRCLNLRFASIYSALFVVMWASIAMSSLFWIDWFMPFLGEPQNIIPVVLYSNPLVVTASCFPDFDYLRSEILYEICSIGSSYPFHYPNVTYVLAGALSQIGLLEIFTNWRSKRAQS